LKVLILTSITPHNIYLVNYLTDNKNIIGKVIEKIPLLSSTGEKMAKRKKLIKKYGFLKTINKLIYNKYKFHAFLKHDTGIVQQDLFPDSTEMKYTKDVPTIEVANINEQKAIEFISGQKPDIIAVCGTSVIKPDVFNLSRIGTINIHCGITPEYRSADPIFWALYNNEPDKVGVTIHFVDEGIDTGNIIYQKAVGVTGDDNLSTLYIKCIKAGAELMVNAIDDLEKGEVKIIDKRNVKGKAYYHMDLGIWQYLTFQRRFNKLKKTLISR
jgi:methionyl-tRNA formyltransferase